MPDEGHPIQVQLLSSIFDATADEWDACAGSHDPFVSHAFLAALEDSGSATAETGWAPQHLAIRGVNGALDACAPLYLKNHSYGEYVFDWGWADAFERAGGRYYPKLQCAVPFTPATGPRLLVRDGASAGLRRALLQAMIERAEGLGVSSVHVTFPLESEWSLAAEMGFLARIGSQFHWTNKDYETFDDFLATLMSRKRKTIRKERTAVGKQGVRLRRLVGTDIQERHWDAFHQFYLDTTDRKWGSAYLTRDFFSQLGERLADKVMLVVAEPEAGGDPLAGALNLIGGDTLYGRNWGCNQDFKFLHFEACYYQAIDHAIETGLRRVEAGAQGQHKVQRGYLPERTYSAHWIAHPGLSAAVGDFIDRESLAIEREMKALMTFSPYRQSDAE